ncbi:MAG TPA: acyl carrier protein [Bacteroidales bacterium]|nr:acyl carrier protein [Bacteroidales bacterium]
MSTEEIKNSIKNFIAETSFTDLSKLSDNVLIFQEGYFDSMGFVSLIAFLEEKFEVQVKDDELLEENFESIKAITDYVTKKLNHQ